MRRDESCLLVIDRSSGRIHHRVFTDLAGYLKKEDCLVLNDTKVMPVSLTAAVGNNGFSRKTDILVLEKTGSDTAACLVKPARKFKKDTEVFFGKTLSATVIEEYPRKVLRFSCPVDKLLKEQGRMPLPPYIKREPDKSDFQTYQTVYAKNKGAVAAPTAGLHFTKAVLNDISKKGIAIEYVTLHVGYGTFRPVRSEDISEHKMHREWFTVSKKTIDAVKKSKRSGAKVVAVGTTSCRVLETIAKERILKPKTGYTNLFIHPPYKFKLTDMLLTNFHLPKTTLLMLVSAFCGHDLMMQAYREAIERQYRLFSYGDAMLIT